MFIGPVCDYVLSQVVKLTTRWNLPILTTGGENDHFRNKISAPLLTTMSGVGEQLGDLFHKQLELYNWYISLLSFWIFFFKTMWEKLKLNLLFSLTFV